MTKQQATYLKAKQALEAAKAAARNDFGEMPADISDEDLEAFCGRETAAEFAHNVPALGQALRNAEADLFAWARTKIQNDRRFSLEIDSLFDSKFLHIREKVIAICLQLAA